MTTLTYPNTETKMETDDDENQRLTPHAQRTQCPVCGQTIPLDSELRAQGNSEPKWPKDYDLTSFLHGDNPGQWAKETVAQLLSEAFDDGDEHGRGLQAIADAHNEAIAAERKETDLWKRQSEFESKHREKYRQQLAAQREQRKPLVDALKKMPEVAYRSIIEHDGVIIENLPNELQCICDDALARLK